MRGYALQELNVWSLKTSDEVGKWSNVHVEPNNKLLGKRLGKDRAKVRGEGGKGKDDRASVHRAVPDGEEAL